MLDLSRPGNAKTSGLAGPTRSMLRGLKTSSGKKVTRTDIQFITLFHKSLTNKTSHDGVTLLKGLCSLWWVKHQPLNCLDLLFVFLIVQEKCIKKLMQAGKLVIFSRHTCARKVLLKTRNYGTLIVINCLQIWTGSKCRFFIIPFTSNAIT